MTFLVVLVGALLVGVGSWVLYVIRRARRNPRYSAKIDEQQAAENCRPYVKIEIHHGPPRE